MTDATQNPFLTEKTAAFGALSLDKIKPEHYTPAFEEGLKQHNAEIAAIIANEEAPSFANTIEAIDAAGQLIKEVTDVLGSLGSAHTSDELQKLESKILPLTKMHNAFIRAGAALPEDKRNELKAINEEIAGLTVKFGQNVLADTNAAALILDEEDLVGLPEDVKAAAAEEAKLHDQEGKYVFTSSRASAIPFLQFSERRDLREKLYNVRRNMGSNGNETDNKAIVSRMAALRARAAKINGYKSHAEYILDDRMAKTPAAVRELLDKLWTPALARAKGEAKAMQDRIQADGQNFELAAWDWWHYAEKVRKDLFDLETDDIKPYFQLENVRDGAFYCAKELYGLTFTPVDNVPTYHPDVEVYDVTDADGSHIGIFMGDFFTRPSKRGGAWMHVFRNQKEGQRPIVYNVCNFAKGAGDKPTLLSMEEVTTLFHEFGHGLHGLLANTRYESLSGTSVKWDFVELPSQIMEHWATEPEVMKVYARHYETSEVIPEELIEKLKKSAKFNQGFATTEYLGASMLDLEWHEIEDEEERDVDEFQKTAVEKIGTIPEIPPRFSSTFFQHIFAGGYSAGYYSYVWAEVLDADGYEAFKEKGIFDQETAKSFRENILEKGGTVDPMELYKRFRGQEPKIEPLLENKGLA